VFSLATDTLNKQSRTADNRWSSSLVVGLGANSFSLYKIAVMLRNITQVGSSQRFNRRM